MKKAVCPFCGKKVKTFITYRGEVVGCPQCGIHSRPTNGDMFRASADEEIARFMTEFLEKVILPQIKNNTAILAESFKNEFLAWLRQKALFESEGGE